MPKHPIRARAQSLRAFPTSAAVAAAVAALAAAFAMPSRAATPPLQVDFLANGAHMVCPAQALEFRKGSSMQVTWQCRDSGTRFRCSMTAAGAFALDANFVALNCNALTEVPGGNPPTLIMASGFESA